MEQNEKKHRKYNEFTLKVAIECVLDKGMSIYRASKEFKIPWSTLKDNIERVKLERQQCPDAEIKMLKAGRPFSLSVKSEQSLVSYITKMQEIGFGLTVNQIRELAFSLAETLETKHRFNSNKKIAGWNWWVAFKERYGLSLRTPENLSYGRAICSNPTVIADFYEKLESSLADHNLLGCPEKIWNCDETGLMYVNKPGKVITKIGKKYVYNRTYAEKGTTTTVLACISAAGAFIPPMVIFKGVRNIPELSNGSYPNSLTRLSNKGWINADLFYEWIEFFNANIPPARPVMLIMDSHASHIAPKVLEFANSHQIVLFTMPAHTSHILQPLDVGVFKPLKTAWRAELQHYKIKNPNQIPTRFDFHNFFTPVYEKSFTPANIRAGFSKSGIYPLNKNAICSDAIAPSTLSEKPQEPMESDSIEEVNIIQDYVVEIPPIDCNIKLTSIQDPLQEEKIGQTQVEKTSISNISDIENEICSNHDTSETIQTYCDTNISSSVANTSQQQVTHKNKIRIHEILILPKWQPKNKTQHKRTVPKAQCLTPAVTLVSDMIQEPQEETITIADLSDQTGTKHLRPKRKNLKMPIKKAEMSSNSKKNKQLEDDWVCGYCNGKYSEDHEAKNGAEWISCSFCIRPYHIYCQSQEVDAKERVYMCDNCSVDYSSGED